MDILNIKKIQHLGYFDILIRGKVELKKLKGQVLWLLPKREEIIALLQAATTDDLHKLKGIILAVEDVESTFELLKSQFRIVKAGGGVVEKEQKLLLIYRYGTWDLPKGKRKGGEATKVAAKREVEEECGICVECSEKICTTYHVIPLRKEKYGLKKTSWYRMKLIDDSYMQPQTEEGIEEVAWFDRERALELTKDSYISICYVMHMYQLRLAQSASAKM